MITILATIFGAIALIGITLLIYEVKHAPMVNEKEPFLWDDYNG